MNPELIKYIQENRPIYTADAIVRQLLAAGYARPDIGTAMLAAGYSEAEAQGVWEAIDGHSGQAPGQPYTSLEDRWGDQTAEAELPRSAPANATFWSALLGYLLLALASLGLAIWMFVFGWQANLAPYTCGAFVAIQLAAYVIWLRARESNPALARALRLGLLIILVGIPLLLAVLFLIVLGYCLIVFSGIR